MKMKQTVFFAAIILFFASCEPDYTPKPRGFFRIDLPAKQYEEYSNSCPFEFKKPVYSAVNRDSSANAEPCWLNVDFIPFNATLHLTYKAIENDVKFEDLQEETRKLAFYHTSRAEEIFETPISKPDKNMHGVIYNLTGNTATAVQFYLTDSAQHYLRGVLYFNSRTEADSIAPVQDFLVKDVYNVINTLKWK